MSTCIYAIALSPLEQQQTSFGPLLRNISQIHIKVQEVYLAWHNKPFLIPIHGIC